MTTKTGSVIQAMARTIAEISEDEERTEKAMWDAQDAARVGPLHPLFAKGADHEKAREFSVEMAERPFRQRLEMLRERRASVERVIANSEAVDLVDVIIQAEQVHLSACLVDDALDAKFHSEELEHLTRIRRMALSIIRHLLAETGVDLTAYGVLPGWLEDNGLAPPRMAAE